MKALLYGRYGQYPYSVEELIKKSGIEIVRENPEIVITHGGDGTFLGAERDYPGIPKIPLRDSAVCHICSALPNDQVLIRLAAGKFKKIEHLKIIAQFKDKKMIALNDVTISNKLPNVAIRFNVTTEPKMQNLKEDELIGDGVIISTPFGSTAYYFSATRQTFSEGIGIGFNNIHNAQLDPIVFPDNTTFKIVVNQGPALLAADNDPELVELGNGDIITIQKSPTPAIILEPLP